MVQAAPTFIIGTWVADPLYDLLTMLLVLAWVVTATILALRNGAMERPSRVAQLYGYTVCLIALVTLLITVPNLIDTFFRLSDPLRAQSQYGEPALSSLDAYKATYDRSQIPRDAQASPAPRPSDEE